MAGYYDPADESFVQRVSGTLILRRWFFRCDINNVRLENLTSSVISCQVRWTHGREGGVPMTANFTFLEGERLNYLADFIAPVIRWEWSGGRTEQTQLGLFALSLPTRTISANGVTSSIDGRDLCWIMKNSYLTKNENITVGTSYDNVFVELAEDSGISRTNIRSSSFLTTSPRTMRRGTNRHEQFSNFAKSIGWYAAQADLYGRIVTLPYRDPLRVAAVGLIDNSILIGDVTSESPASEIPNVVMVRVDRSDLDPIISFARNNDANSPSSILNTGHEVLIEYNESDIETQAAADDLAKQRLREVSSYYETMQVTVPPNIAFLAQNQRVDVDIHSGPYIFHGAWAIREWTIGMEPDTAMLKMGLGRTVDVS